ncbi:hypothetical protein Bbelb_131790 [Branchiostoma belcheri]|nr:hypothetical protein Bbelb_131790 [Branchiostoma belcheri]
MKADAVVRTYCLNLTRQIGPDDLKTKEEYQKTDWTRPDLDDLKTQEEYQVCPELKVGCPVWEKPVDLKMQKEMKTVGTVVTYADPETGLQQEEEPDFCRQGCVKEDGEV